MAIELLMRCNIVRVRNEYFEMSLNEIFSSFVDTIDSKTRMKRNGTTLTDRNERETGSVSSNITNNLVYLRASQKFQIIFHLLSSANE